ncbi:unnamed protein product [Camellia sinensis]
MCIHERAKHPPLKKFLLVPSDFVSAAGQLKLQICIWSYTRTEGILQVHVVRTNGEIPSVDEATLDHQRLLDSYCSYMSWWSLWFMEMEIVRVFNNNELSGKIPSTLGLLQTLEIFVHNEFHENALQMEGISVVGQNYYGVFPLRGALLNVREASHKQIMENAEITSIKQIVGLQHGKQYDSVKTLRYGHLMTMTDQFLATVSHEIRTPMNGVLGKNVADANGHRSGCNSTGHPIAISTARKVKHVFANDLNPFAVEYLERNCVLNKLERKIEVFNMDERRFIDAMFASQKAQSITQVVMNLPNDAAEYLDG